MIAGDQIIDASDLAKFKLKLEAAYGRNYTDASESTDAAKAEMTFELCKMNGWTKNEFSDRLKQFIAHQIFPTWKPAEFIEGKDEHKFDRPKLYPESWMKKEMEKNINAKGDMEAWEIDLNGERWTGWRYHDGAEVNINPALNPVKIWPPKMVKVKDSLGNLVEIAEETYNVWKEEKERKVDFKPMAKEELDTMRKLAEAKFEIADLKEEIRILQSVIESKDRVIANLKAELDIYKGHEYVVVNTNSDGGDADG